MLGNPCLNLTVDLTVWEAQITVFFGLALLIIIYQK